MMQWIVVPAMLMGVMRFFEVVGFKFTQGGKER